MARSCFFIGHREAGAELLPLLAEAVERHITEYGVTDFYVGHYGSFDGMAAHAVKEARGSTSRYTLSDGKKECEAKCPHSLLENDLLF